MILEFREILKKLPKSSAVKPEVLRKSLGREMSTYGIIARKLVKMSSPLKTDLKDSGINNWREDRNLKK